MQSSETPKGTVISLAPSCLSRLVSLLNVVRLSNSTVQMYRETIKLRFTEITGAINRNTEIPCTCRSLRFMVTQSMDTMLDLILRKPYCDLFSAMFAKCCTTPDMYANAITSYEATSQN